MSKEVRQMLKNWRNLKSVQQKIAALEVSFSQSAGRPPSVVDLRRVASVYQLEKKKINYLKTFWMLNESRWTS